MSRPLLRLISHSLVPAGTPVGALFGTSLGAWRGAFIRPPAGVRAAALAGVLAGGLAPRSARAHAQPAEAARGPLGAALRAGADTLDAYDAALAGLPRDARTALAALVDSTRAAGLPAAPLERKVVEGVAKGADPARITQIVRAVAAGLRAARGALGAASDAELEAGGAAVQAGVPPDELRRVRASLPRGRPATQAFVILTDLARRGVPPGEGARAVARLVRAGARDADLAQWRAEVATDLAAGVSPAAAASGRTDTFLQARRPAGAPVVAPTPGPLDP